MHAWALPAAIKVACDDTADAGGGDSTWTAAQPPTTSASATACRSIWCRSLPGQTWPGRHIPLPDRRRIQRRPCHIPTPTKPPLRFLLSRPRTWGPRRIQSCSHRFWPASGPACRTPQMADRASGRGRGPPVAAASSRGQAVPPESVIQQHAAADRTTHGLQRLPVAPILGSSGVVSPQPQDAPQLLPPGRFTGSVNSAEQAQEWRKATSREFSIIELPGDHMYLVGRAQEVLDLIEAKSVDG